MGGTKQENANRGRWTQEEHEAFLQGLNKYGKDWKRIGAEIPTRTIVQIRTHAQKYFAKAEKEERRKNGVETNKEASHSTSKSTHKRPTAALQKKAYKPAGDLTPVHATVTKNEPSPQNDPQRHSPVRSGLNVIQNQTNAQVSDDWFRVPAATSTQQMKLSTASSQKEIIRIHGDFNSSSSVRDLSSQFRVPTEPSQMNFAVPMEKKPQSEPRVVSLTSTVRIPAIQRLPKRQRASTDGDLSSQAGERSSPKRLRAFSYSDRETEFPASHGDNIRYMSPLHLMTEADSTDDPLATEKDIFKPGMEGDDYVLPNMKTHVDFTPRRLDSDPPSVEQPTSSPFTEVGNAESSVDSSHCDVALKDCDEDELSLSISDFDEEFHFFEADHIGFGPLFA